MALKHAIINKHIYHLLWIGLCLGLFSTNAYAQNDSTIYENYISESDIDSANYVIIQDIILEGNKITKERIITRELDIKAGDSLSLSQLEEVFSSEKNKLINTNLFETVNITYSIEKSTYIIITITMKERWYTWPIPIFELADRSLSEWINNRGADFSRVRYGIHFKRDNFRGVKETLDLLIRGGFSTLVSLKYNIPFVDKQQKTSLSFAVSYSDTKNLAYGSVNNKFVEVNLEDEIVAKKFAFSTSMGKRIGFYDYHGIGGGFYYTQIADTVVTLNPEYLLGGRHDQQYFSLYYTYVKDMRDIRAYPLDGYYLRGNFIKYGLGIFDDLNSFMISADYFKYTPIGKGFFHEIGMVGMLSYPALQPYALSRALGYGTKTIRGYDNYVVEGQHLGIMKNTVRFRLLDREFELANTKYFSKIPLGIYIKGFGDMGYIHSSVVEEQNQRLTNDLLIGWGAGIDVITFYNSSLKLNYSFNKHDQIGRFYISIASSI
ncbi:BamA/TamA family outer membrane protein [Algivirga pacifica]|uniref:POTRA domain-containing protein n=1 Tax=Algivirga pacifica TaxID=1162670 RepID=A0ABP9D7U8_9BACT